MRRYVFSLPWEKRLARMRALVLKSSSTSTSFFPSHAGRLLGRAHRCATGGRVEPRETGSKHTFVVEHRLAATHALRAGERSFARSLVRSFARSLVRSRAVRARALRSAAGRIAAPRAVEPRETGPSMSAPRARRARVLARDAPESARTLARSLACCAGRRPWTLLTSARGIPVVAYQPKRRRRVTRAHELVPREN
jgi:hypothetical protein